MPTFFLNILISNNHFEKYGFTSLCHLTLKMLIVQRNVQAEEKEAGNSRNKFLSTFITLLTTFFSRQN